MLEEAITWGMKHGFCDEELAANYRAHAKSPTHVNQFIAMMAVYSRTLRPPVLTNKEGRVLDRKFVDDGVVPPFFAPFLGV